MKSSLTNAQPRFAQRMRSRFVALATVAALGATALVGALPLVNSTAANAAPDLANPMGVATPIDSDNGFTIYATGDVALFNAELEGSAAVFGSIFARTTGNQYPVVHQVAGNGDYDLPVLDGKPVRLYVNRLATSGTAGTVEHQLAELVVKSQGSSRPSQVGGALIHDRSVPVGWSVQQGHQSADVAFYQTGGNNQAPRLADWTRTFAAAGANAFTPQQPNMSDYFNEDNGVALLADTSGWSSPTAPTDQNNPWQLNEGPNAIALAQLRAVTNQRFQIAGHGTDDRALYIKVSNSDIDSNGLVFLPELNQAGNVGANAQASYVLWDFSEVTQDFQITSTGNRVRGAIYAPNSVVTLSNGLQYEGQIVSAGYVHGPVTGGTPGGEEIHTNLFKGRVPNVATTPEPEAELATGTISLAKAVVDGDGDPIAAVGYSFTYDWVAMHATETLTTQQASGSVVVPGSGAPVVLSAGGTAIEFPEGTTVMFAEGPVPAIPGYTFDRQSAPAVTVVADSVTAATGTNTYTEDVIVVPATGGFTVSKVVAGDSALAGLPDEYIVNYSVDGVAQAPLEIAPGSPGRVDGLPVGATVVLTEVAPVDTADFEWAAPAWDATTSGGSNPTVSGNQVTLTVVEGDGSNVAFAVTNTVTEIEDEPTTGGFTVSKVLTGDTTVAGLPAEYVINYSVDGVAQDALEVAAGDSASVSDLPVGSVVTLTEVVPADTADFEWAAPSWEVTSAGGSDAAASGNQVTFTVVEGDAADVVFTVTNTVTETDNEEPATGKVSLSKRVQDQDEVTLASGSTAFEFSWTATGTDLTPAQSSGTVSVLGNGAAVVLTSGGSDIEFPVGTVVTFQETFAPSIAGYSFVEVNSGGVTVVADQTTNLVATNTYAQTQTEPETGSFTIAKALNNPDSVPGLPSTYTIEYQLDGGDWVQVSLTAGGLPVTVSGLELGTEVAVREATPAAIAGATWAEPVISESAFTITTAEVTTPLAVTVTNEITEDPEVPSDTSFSTHAHTGATPNGELTVTNNVVTDHVYLVNPQSGAEYVLQGEMVYVDGGQIIRTGITNSVTYIGGTNPADDDGVETFYSDFTLTPAQLDELAGKKLFVFQYLYDGEGSLLQSDDATEAYSAWFNTTNEWVTVAVDSDTDTPDEDPDGPDEGPDGPGDGDGGGEDGDGGGSGDGSGGGEGSGGGTATGTPELPVTGSNSGRIALFAMMLLAAGGVAVGLSRRFAS